MSFTDPIELRPEDILAGTLNPDVIVPAIGPLQTKLDATAANVNQAQADIATLNTSTLPALQTQVNGILPITETKITDQAITTPKIAALAVTASQIAAGAVTTAKLDAGAVTADKITAGTITATELAANAVTAAKIQAGAIDGKTITGALIRTAATGQRTALNGSDVPQGVAFYSGDPVEVFPGTIVPVQTPDEFQLAVISPTAGLGGARLNLAQNKTTKKDRFNATASFIELMATDGVTINSVPVATTTDPQTLTHKDLRDPSNKMPFRGGTGDFVVTSTATAGSAGRITVPHGLGTTPTWATMSVIGVSSFICAPVAFSPTAVQFDITYRDISGMPPANGSTVTVCWLAGITTA